VSESGSGPPPPDEPLGADAKAETMNEARTNPNNMIIGDFNDRTRVWNQRDWRFWRRREDGFYDDRQGDFGFAHVHPCQRCGRYHPSQRCDFSD
jgi:hypothetical protein